MRTGIVVEATTADRARLKAMRGDRNSPQKHVRRAEIVLLTSDGLGINEIMRRTGRAKTAAWRWQERFMRAGVDGLLRDKTRPPRIPPLTSEVAERMVALTLREPPGETNPLDGGRHGRGERGQRQLGATNLALVRAPAPSAPAV